MWKLCATGAIIGIALGLSGCGGGPGLGAWLPNSYLTPVAGEATSRISFAGQSDDPNVLVYMITQSPGAWTPSGNRQILMLTGNRPWDSIPVNGSFNTISKSYEEADRTITFSATGPLYFSAFLANGEFTYGSGYTGTTYTCEIGFTFMPRPEHDYTVVIVGRAGRCTVVVSDDATGSAPESFRIYDPSRR